MLHRDGEVDKVLSKVAEQQAHEGLKGANGARCYKSGLVKPGTPTWAAPAAIAATTPIAFRMSSLRVEKLKGNDKDGNWSAKRERTNRKRLVNETGLRSSSSDWGLPRSGEARSSGKGEGGIESKLSTCFDLSQEKRPL